MTVLILANSDVGLYKFRKELLERLVSDGNEVYASFPDGEFAIDIERLRCHVIKTEISRHGTNPFEDIKLMCKYDRMLKKIRPDIVFTYTIKPNIYGGIICALNKIPYVTNITGLGTAVENGGLLQKITLILYKIGLRKAQKVFFQNTENKDFMLNRGIVTGPYEILPGSGVNLNQYIVYSYPNDSTVDFVFIARIMKEKGIDQYLDAAEYITKRYPETRFHVCGFCEQDYKDKLEILNNSGTVIYHGLISEMTDIYKKASCIVLPTYYPEGLSNVLLESCACGRPIITTDRSGCREVVDNGVNGLIVKAKDSGDLIRRIEEFLNLSAEQRCKMGLAGRKKVEKEFDRQIVVQKYIDEIMRIET